MASLNLRNINKRYEETEVIRSVNLDIADGEFVVFVGPSGCGKSTLMRMIAGLEDISGGDLMIDGTRVNDVPPAKRGIAMVFQSYALYPHMTVFENMSFALKLAGVAKETIRQKVNKAAAILNLTDYLERTPKALSGGQRQRVAIGRAIVRAPKVFLFDEPLSNLDAALRGQTRLEIARLHRELGATTIYVTHDQVEAMTLADRVVVLRDGAIEQVGTPLELYDRPANQFVAQFIGTPRMNIMPLADLPRMPASDTALPANGFIGIRPEYVEVGALSSSAAYPAIVDVVESLGAETLIYSTLENGVQIVARRNERSDINPGDRVGLLLNQQHLHVFDPAGKVVAAQGVSHAAAH